MVKLQSALSVRFQEDCSVCSRFVFFFCQVFLFSLCVKFLRFFGRSCIFSIPPPSCISACHLSVRSSAWVLVHPSLLLRPPVHPSIRSSVSFTCSSVCPFITRSLCLSVRPSVYPLVLLFARLLDCLHFLRFFVILIFLCSSLSLAVYIFFFFVLQFSFLTLSNRPSLITLLLYLRLCFIFTISIFLLLYFPIILFIFSHFLSSFFVYPSFFSARGLICS